MEINHSALVRHPCARRPILIYFILNISQFKIMNQCRNLLKTHLIYLLTFHTNIFKPIYKFKIKESSPNDRFPLLMGWVDQEI